MTAAGRVVVGSPGKNRETKFRRFSLNKPHLVDVRETSSRNQLETR